MTETNDVQIERTFDAPVSLIWSMWTEAEHFASWFGPTGAVISKAEIDAQVGGRRHIGMDLETPNGPMQMFFVGEFRELTPMTRLAYSEMMGDADGNTLNPEDMGMPEGASIETTVVVELEDLGDQTRMSMAHIGVPADSPGGNGWAMAIQKLEERIATAL